jgi:hypothetical protein
MFMSWGPGLRRFSILVVPKDHQLCASYGVTTAELNRIESALAASLAALCNEWERIHGDY